MLTYDYKCIFPYGSSPFRGMDLAKSILVSEATHKKLVMAKMELGFKSMDQMLARIISEVSKARFLEASQIFRSRMQRRHQSLAEVWSSSEAIRIELFRKWFESKESHS
jgi:ssDNA-specific exonuclease RecJ